MDADLVIFLDLKPGSGNLVCSNCPFRDCHQGLFPDLPLVADQQNNRFLHQIFQDYRYRCNAIFLRFVAGTTGRFARKHSPGNVCDSVIMGYLDIL